MFDRLVRGWQLTKQSFHVLRHEKQLLVFPLFSGVASLLVMASFALPVLLSIDWQALAASRADSGQTREIVVQPWYYAVLFLFYFTQYTVIAYFNAALIACAINRFNGEDTSLGAGLAVATRRLPQILAWSLVNSTVGMLLQMISERAGLLGKIVISLVGMVWTIATFFVVPVLVVEGIGPFDAIKRSMGILRKAWGESLVGNASISVFTGLIAFLLMAGLTTAGVALSISMDSPWPAVVFIAAALVSGVLIALISSAMKMILIAACYRFATTGLIPEHFEGDTLRSMFRKK